MAIRASVDTGTALARSLIADTARPYGGTLARQRSQPSADVRNRVSACIELYRSTFDVFRLPGGRSARRRRWSWSDCQLSGRRRGGDSHATDARTFLMRCMPVTTVAASLTASGSVGGRCTLHSQKEAMSAARSTEIFEEISPDSISGISAAAARRRLISGVAGGICLDMPPILPGASRCGEDLCHTPVFAMLSRCRTPVVGMEQARRLAALLQYLTLQP